MAASDSTRQGIPVRVIGGAFLTQYYRILHESPEIAWKYYKDTSIVSRPDSDGTMTTVTTFPKIREKVVPLGLSDCLMEIQTACAQPSHMDALIVVAAGRTMSSSDGVARGFSQSFFLAPQESGGFFVMNDVFHFVGTPLVLARSSPDHGGDHQNGVSAGAEPAAGDERRGNPAAERSRSSQSESNGGSDAASGGDGDKGWLMVEAESEENATYG